MDCKFPLHPRPVAVSALLTAFVTTPVLLAGAVADHEAESGGWLPVGRVALVLIVAAVTTFIALAAYDFIALVRSRSRRDDLDATLRNAASESITSKNPNSDNATGFQNGNPHRGTTPES